MINSVPKNIAGMLPDHISSDYPLFTEFLTAYYAFLNQTTGPDNIIKNMLSYTDIDETIDSFKEHIFSELLTSIPDSIVANRTLLAKHIKELYIKKGTEDSYRLLFRILFDKEIDINYPADQILKLSDGKWDQKTSFICHIPNTVTDTVVKSAIGRKVVIQLDNKELAANILNVEKLETTDVNNNLYEFFIKKDFFDDFSSATSVSFKKISSITISNQGNNYSDTDEVRLLSIDGGRTNINIITSSGKITNTIINDGGIGFVDSPILNIISDKGTNGYIVANLSDIYTGTILNSISNITILKPATGYIEGKVYNVDYNSGTGAILQIKHNDINRNVKKISISAFGEYYPDNFNYIINKEKNIASASGVITSGVITSLTIVDGGLGYTIAPTVTVYGDGYGAEITCSLAGGIVTGYTIVNGGFGYTQPPAIVFSDTSIAVNISNNKLRTYNGAYISTDGFISSDMIIYDGIYYQKFSYEIVIDELFDIYRGALKKMLHPAGYAAWGVYDLRKILTVQLNSNKIDVERNSSFLDIIYNTMQMVFDISKQLNDIYDSSTCNEVTRFVVEKALNDIYDSSTCVEVSSFNILKALNDIYDSSTCVEVSSFNILKKMDDVSDSSTYTDLPAFNVSKALNDILDTPIMYDINNRYAATDYFAEDYVYIAEFAMIFNKPMTDVSDSSLYVENINIVFD